MIGGRRAGRTIAMATMAMLAGLAGTAVVAGVSDRAVAPPRVSGNVQTARKSRRRRHFKPVKVLSTSSKGTPFRRADNKKRSPRMRWDRRPPQSLDADKTHTTMLPIAVFLNGKRVTRIAYNIQEEWVRVMDRGLLSKRREQGYEWGEDEAIPTLTLRGRVTVKWTDPTRDGRDFKCYRLKHDPSDPTSRRSGWSQRGPRVQHG